MYKIRLREDRGRTFTHWLDSAHTFSYAQYFDPFNMGFSDLRAINDNILLPDGGFDMHSHTNMEIVNIIVSGQMEQMTTNPKYKDRSEILSKNTVQVISAGAGTEYKEFNPSNTERLHFLQVWILPRKKNFEPTYATKYFTDEKLKNQLRLIVSGNGANGSLKIMQDADIYRSFLDMDYTVAYDLPPNRKIWIQVLSGAIEINSNILEAGDGISIIDERGYLEITGVETQSDFCIFSLRNLTI